MGVMASPVNILDMDRIEARKPVLERLKMPNFVVRCPIEAF
jgi:hypothetical protein